MTLTLREAVAALDEMFPPETSQSWDQVGLVSGDPGQGIERIVVALDPTLEVIAQARHTHADLIVTHHPLLMRGIHSVATTSAKGASVTNLIVGDVALYVAHTNADVVAGGVNDALAAAAGLSEVEPLVIIEGQPLGRVGVVPAPMSLAEFAAALYAALPPAASGLRVSGPAGAIVQRIAVLGGAGDDQFAAARESGADVYVTADLRHHPALEAREESRGGPPYLIDAGHWSSESVWLPQLRDRLRETLRVDVTISTVRTDPWTFTVGAVAPGGMP